MKTEEKSNTWMRIGRHGFQSQFDFLSIHIQPCKRTSVPLSIFAWCSELWISKHFPSTQSLPHYKHCSYMTALLLPQSGRQQRQQTHRKKASKTKLYVLPELKHTLLWSPLAIAVSEYQMQWLTLCEVRRACACLLTPSHPIVWYNMQWACYQWNTAYQLS